MEEGRGILGGVVVCQVSVFLLLRALLWLELTLGGIFLVTSSWSSIVEFVLS